MIISGIVKRPKASTIESRTLSSTVFGFLQLVLTFVSSILLVPILISNWGTEKYSIYLNLFAFIQLLRTLDLGHQAFVGNEFNREIHADKDKARSILASSVMMAVVLGFVELIIFLGLWWTGKTYSFLGIPSEHATPLMFGVLCMVIMWWIVGSVSGIAVKVVLSKGLYAATVLWAIVLKILEISLLVFAGLCNISLFHFMWLWATVNLIFNFFVLRWAYLQLKDDGLQMNYRSWKQAWQTFRSSIVITVNYGFEQVAVSGINFLITRYLTLVLLPVYTTIRTITNTAIQMTILITNPLQSEMIRYHGERAGEKIKSVIKTFSVVNGFLINFGLIAILPFIEFLYNIWTNQLLVFNRPLFGMLCLSVSIYNYGRALTTYLNGINDLKSLTWISISRCVITLGVIFFFVKPYGLVVVGLAIFIAEVISSLIIPALRAQKIMHAIHTELDWGYMFLTFIPFIVLAVAYFSNIWLHLNVWLVTSVGMSFIVAIYVIAWKRLEVQIQQRLKALVVRYLRIRRFN